jgi:crotonobetaine/carnitine-CoA ligase
MRHSNQHSSQPFGDVADRTLPRILRHWAESEPDRELLTFPDGTTLTFGEMELRSSRTANGLARLGVTRFGRVAILLPTCPELVLTWFGAAKLGAVEVPVNIELRGRLLAHVLANSEASVAVTDLERVPQLAEVVGRSAIRTVVVVGATAAEARAAGLRGVDVVELGEVLAAPSTSLDVPVEHCDPIAILYTSGTTGPAKGVLMPHHQYFVWVELYARSLGLTRDDSYFTPLPLFHADGQLWGVYFPLVYGTKGTLENRFSASRYWDQVRASGATATNLLGAMAHILWKQPAGPRDAEQPLRIAQALPMVPFKEEFQDRFGMRLVTGYGQTETSWVSYDTVGESRPGSCGKVADDYFEVRVVDEQDSPLPPGKQGEIVVRPRQPWTISLGYHGAPEATLSAWRNLWFHSGDAGHLDEDGWLYFADRIKDAIRVKGTNISAYELESVVNDHPGVLESAAVAVSSALSEDDVLLFVVADGQVTPEDVHGHCVRTLPKPMVPRYIELHDGPLPRTPTEKVSKNELRARGLGPRTWDASSRSVEATA